MARRGNRTGSVYKRATGGAYLASYYTADGKRRERSTNTTDKALALRVLARYVEIETLKTHGLVDPKADTYKAADAVPLAQHAADWKADLLARGGTKTHAELSYQRVASIIEGCGWERIGDISATAAQSYLADRRKPKLPGVQTPAKRPPASLSAASSNHYLRAAKGFARWLVREGRARDNALAHLSLLNEKVGRCYERRAFSADELRRLIQDAARGPAWQGIPGADRAVLYRMAAESGLRASELRSLTVGSFRLTDTPPTVVLLAAYSKRRRQDEQPIPPDLAGALARYFRGKLPTAPAFRVPRPQRTGAMIHYDMAAAGIPATDADGRKADFHALRHTYISNLTRGGVHPKLAQTLARHSTVSLTLDRYSHTLVGELSGALDVLPDLDARPAETGRAVAVAGGGSAELTPRNVHSNRGAKRPESQNATLRTVSQVPSDCQLRKGPETKGNCDTLRSSAVKLAPSAACPSGLRERIANP